MGFSIETIRPCTAGFRCAIFDFDGTVSLIRAGWQEIMIPYFCEVLQTAAASESEEAIHTEVKEFVDRLTGKQTIYQCMALADAVTARGQVPAAPGEYKKEYLRRLSKKIAAKKDGLKNGSIAPEALSVKGSIPFIRGLRNAGITCYLASGTDEADVIYEAELLGIADAFNGGIFGAREALTDCSKEAVIRRLLRNDGLRPNELLGFGDGFVEIQLVHEQGGYAVGVATDEKHGDGIEESKRKRLLDAGANMIIPHFENCTALLSALHVIT